MPRCPANPTRDRASRSGSLARRSPRPPPHSWLRAHSRRGERVPSRRAAPGPASAPRTSGAGPACSSLRHSWQMLSHERGCGSGMTCWRRLRDWQAGVWERLHHGYTIFAIPLVLTLCLYGASLTGPDDHRVIPVTSPPPEHGRPAGRLRRARTTPSPRFRIPPPLRMPPRPDRSARPREAPTGP